MSGVADWLADTRVCVVGGSGGVGKTTTSAALAAGMAARGLKVAVVTIDPAQRLATALGLDELDNEPQRIASERFAAAGLPLGEGELWAMTLDPKRTFDELIARLSPDDDTRERILANRVYRELSDAIAGSQEFTAVAKLHELAQDGGWDLLVLDTPPSRNALDFLDAPDRLRAFFEGRALQTLLRGGGAGLRLLGRGTGLVLGLLRRVTGAELLSDLSDFFRLLGGLLGGFRERAQQVEELLRAPGTTFLLVTSPEREPIDEALFFQRRLRSAGMTLGGAVVNRMHVDADALAGEDDALLDLPARIEQAAGLSPALAKQVAAAYADEHRLARRDAANMAHLRERLGGRVPLLQVPLLEDDVHDVAGLVRLYVHLFAASEAP